MYETRKAGATLSPRCPLRLAMPHLRAAPWRTKTQSVRTTKMNAETDHGKWFQFLLIHCLICSSVSWINCPTKCGCSKRRNFSYDTRGAYLINQNTSNPTFFFVRCSEFAACSPGASQRTSDDIVASLTV